MFNVEIWGTVSDWVMVIVAIITACFLYKTLRSQTYVQKVQMKLFEIEKVRLSQEIKPVFNYGVLSMEPNEAKTILHVFISIRNVSENTARNLIVEELPPPHSSAFFGIQDLEIEGMLVMGPLQRVLGPNEQKSINYFINYNGENFPNTYVTFIVYWEDAIKNKYWEKVRCIPIEGRIFLKIYKAEIEMFDSMK